MHVELYERIWMWVAAGIIVLFLAAMLIPAAVLAIHPPSHIETVDPASLATHPEFASGLVTTRPDGSVVVSVIATMFFLVLTRSRYPADSR